MSIKKRRLLAVALAAVTVAAGCGSSSKSSSSGKAATLTVGILTDYTGVSSSSNKTTVQGVEAGIARAAQGGYHVNYVVGDTTSSPAGALSAAENLVEVHHVAVVVADSTFTFAAASFLTKNHVPVIGAAEDGPEWITATNMFSVYGAVDTTKASTSFGDFLKMEGVTNLGALGYGVSPASAEAAKGNAASAQKAGIKVGYLNANFSLGSTNVVPVALAMKAAGVNGFTGSLEPNTALNLIVALRQEGVDLRAGILATGYGGDILQAGPGALQNAQGVYFFTSFEPIEMHTAATERFESLLNGLGIKSDPTYAEYVGYASMAMLVQALQAAGNKPTSASLLTALTGITDYNAWGLFGNHSFTPADKSSQAIGSPPCVYYTKLSGSKFELVAGADPICGTEIPGLTVSAAS